MTRSEFPPSVKVAAFKRCGGQCEGCTARLYPGKFDYDHDHPDGLGGPPTLENCRVLCLNCHSAKTHKEDRPKMAKADRQRKRHIGAKPKSRPIPGSKASGIRKRMSGRVEAW